MAERGPYTIWVIFPVFNVVENRGQIIEGYRKI